MGPASLRNNGIMEFWNNGIKAIQPTNKNRGISIVIKKEGFRFYNPIFQHSILRVKSQ
jgi:hypothetical protein